MPLSGEQFPAFLAVVSALEAKGYESVLVGGMALVTMGSQRLTRDFDLLVPDRDAEQLVQAMYACGLEMVTKFNAAGEVQRTVDALGGATTKVRAKELKSIPFFDWRTRLRVDLLLDFPVPAREVIQRAIRVSVKGGTIRIASREDLIRLKEIASRGRKSAGDAQDLEFLRRLQKKR